ncbi:hypothetical protein AQUCO_01300762v1 [Aquilegia coerulea]|uniref:Protein kinase domain-containing protein n=1 Tax=Aquilegia coerulea TaxID=218851 RepID=A0A2G5E382_AQUCA|nr:hypothetical protein AQUCO_01300762v1 [Aquilegia coerulea]
MFSCLLSAAAQSQCQRECGNLNVPFPFGMGDSPECFRDSSFSLFCNETVNPPVLFYGNIPILNISVETATALVQIDTALNCYSENGVSTFDQFLFLGDSPFTFSTLNKFTAIGCDTLSVLAYTPGQLGTGCFSTCNSSTEIPGPSDITQGGNPCPGIGCCQTTIPRGLKQINISLSSPFNHDNILESNPCDYGFLAASSEHSLQRSLLSGGVSSVVALDWAIGDTTCGDARSSGGNQYICGPNTNCNNSDNGHGYRCSCTAGYEGNPYTQTGCTDIDECLPQYETVYTCKGKCKNIEGSYTCHCSFGYGGDGKVECKLRTVVKVLLAFVLPLLWFYQRKMKEANQRKNGGLLLKHLSVKIFQEGQLKKATDNYRKVLGEGGNGWVFKGSVDNTEIAVKKSKRVDQDQIEQFLNEVDIVSKINHKNVVKLLGVCLETKVPMLVYEFVSNGTLSDHLHAKGQKNLFPWSICLRIATETARALDYMHSLADPPIVHRDIKTANILLDGKYTAKVADFGASKLIPLNQAMGHTRGQGTMGYLDPEYLQTGELTVRSDVYGFGVVLMELLCKRKPLTRGESGETISIVKVFTANVAHNQLNEILKIGDVNEYEMEHVHKVAELAVKCVAMPSTDRPTMTEVTNVLDGLSKQYQKFDVEERSDELGDLQYAEQDVVTTSVQFDLESPMLSV